MMKFLKRFFVQTPEVISRTEPGFEEGEHRTPWTGVVLLVVMFIAGLFFGWRALDDLARVPEQPPQLSYCSNRYEHPELYPSPVSYPADDLPYRPSLAYNGELEPICIWSDLETTHGIPALEEQRRAIIRSIRDENTTERQALVRAVIAREQLERQYDEKLQELQAGVPASSSEIQTLRGQLDDARNAENLLRASVDRALDEALTKSQELKAIDLQLAERYRAVFAEQNRRLRWYEFKVFLLQMLFMLPLFLLALRAYVRHLRRNSPYAIILTAVVAVAGVLLLRVILTWFWDLFLARLIEILWEWIQNFEILRSIVFYLGMVLSFVIFGGAVYYLQKRIFDPRRVAIRRFRQNQCPQCQTTLDLADAFCPNCGHHVRDRCPNCSQLRLRELPYCPHCGTKN